MNNGYPAHTPAVAFSIGTLDIHTYALTMMSGFLLAIATVLYFWIKRGYSIELLEVMIIVIVPSSIIGARLWYVLGNLSNPDVRSNWYAFWDGGLAIQGGVTVSGLAGVGIMLLNRHQADWMDAIGIILPSVLIGQAIGRWGNFANHEVFGRITSHGSVSWLGSWIASNMLITSNGVTAYRVPLFFYEFLTSLVGYVILVWVLQIFAVRTKLKPATPGALYLIWYGIVRAIMEPLRDPSDIMKWGALDISIFYAALYIAVGIGLLVWFEFLTKRYVKQNGLWTLKIQTRNPLKKVKYE